MKERLVWVLVLFFLPFVIYIQNMILNPGFEQKANGIPVGWIGFV
ncbi:MAG: hypothetical protein PVH88_17905 [Ignavibacteria bacterium]|jgi:hypothetical protein